MEFKVPRHFFWCGFELLPLAAVTSHVVHLEFRQAKPLQNCFFGPSNCPTRHIPANCPPKPFPQIAWAGARPGLPLQWLARPACTLNFTKSLGGAIDSSSGGRRKSGVKALSSGGGVGNLGFEMLSTGGVPEMGRPKSGAGAVFIPSSADPI